MATYSLRRPLNEAEWQVYHTIRRRVLFENRGATDYDATHPDECRDGNHPLLLFLNDEPMGTIRVDIRRDAAIFRRVAVPEAQQRKGHGSAMLALAEKYASERGCTTVRSFLSPDAVGFYERCGFHLEYAAGANHGDVPMSKSLHLAESAP